MTDSSSDPQASRTARVDENTASPRASERSEPTGGGRLEVSGTQVAASVLASVSAAVVASFFGVAGTIIGTAVVSVVATVGSAAYSLGIRRTQHRLHRLQELRPTRPFPPVRSRGEATAAPETEADDDPEPSARDAAADGGWRGWLAERRWSVAAGLALVFVISLVTVTLIELAGDGTLSRHSSGSARTSIGALVFGDGDDGGRDDVESDTDADTDGSGTDSRDPATPAEDVPGATTTTSPTGATTTTTTSTDPGVGGEPPASTSTTSTTSTPSTTAPGEPTTPGVPDGQAAPPPVPTTAEPPPAG